MKQDPLSFWQKLQGTITLHDAIFGTRESQKINYQIKPKLQKTGRTFRWLRNLKAIAYWLWPAARGNPTKNCWFSTFTNILK